MERPENPADGMPFRGAPKRDTDSSVRRSAVVRLLLAGVGGCDSSVERGARHAHVFGYLCGGFAGADESLCVLDLAEDELYFPPAEVFSGRASFADTVGDAFSFDFQFH